MKEINTILERDTTYEWEVGKKFFGNYFEEPKSNQQVFKELSDADKELFYKIVKTKKLTLEAQWELMAEALKQVENGDDISDDIKEILIKDSLCHVSILAFNYLTKYNTIYTYSDFICEGYLALQASFDKWLKKDDIEKLRNILNGEDIFANYNTYALNNVKNAFAVMIAEDTTLSISLSTQKKLKAISSAKANFIKKFGRIPSDSELAEFVGTTERTIKSGAIFLNRVKTADVSDIDIQEAYKEVCEFEAQEKDDVLMQLRQREIIKKYMKQTLSKQEIAVVNGYYFENKTWKQVAKEVGLTSYQLEIAKENIFAKLQTNKDILSQMLRLK